MKWYGQFASLFVRHTKYINIQYDIYLGVNMLCVRVKNNFTKCNKTFQM